MQLKYALQELGFSAQDAEIYLALLKVGESSVGAIISETGFHRDLVYGGLKRLEQQGLIQSLEKKKIRHYQAGDPSILLRKVTEKAQLTASILPELKSIFAQSPVGVRVYEGAEGLEEIEKDWAVSLKDKEEFYCIGGAGKAWYAIAKSFYRPYHEKLYQRGIRAKTVTFPNEVAGIVENELPGFNPVRVLPEAYRVPSSTIIYADKILIQIFGERFIGIVIQSKAVSDAYREYFNMLWKLAKPIKESSSKKKK